MASYHKPCFALALTLASSQVETTASCMVMHSLNSHRSIIPPATMSWEGEEGLGLAETNHLY
jgi:hypothetical protein